MLRLEEAPLISRLTRIDIARLVPDVREITLKPSERLNVWAAEEPMVYVVRSGLVELVGNFRDCECVLADAITGDMFGEEGVVGAAVCYEVRCIEPSSVFAIPVARLRSLIQGYPDIMLELNRRIAARLAVSQQELLRAKAGLAIYSRELWGVLDEGIAVAQAAALSEPFDTPAGEQAQEGASPENISGFGRTKAAAVLGASLAGAAVAWTLWESGWAPGMALTTGVLLWAVVNWTFDTLPDYVVALASLALLAATGVVKVGVALSGYANSTWFLSLAVIGIGTAIGRSGLLFRVALHMLRLLPSTYWGQSLALALAGLILTPILPSPSGRVAIASPLAVELAEAMRLPPRSNGSAGLGMSVLLGFGQMYFMFLNGTGSCILLWGLLPEAVRAQVTWGYWLLAALPLGAVVFGLGFAAIMVLLKPETHVLVKRETLLAQLRTLGPMSSLERTTLLLVAAVLLAFIAQPFHQVDPAWIAVFGLVYLIGAGIMDRESFRRSIDWNFLILYGALIGLAGSMESTGISAGLSRQISLIFQPLLSHPALFLTAVALVTTMLRLAVPMVATSLLMAITLYPLAPLVGISPFVITLAIQVASNPWFLEHQNTFYQTAVAGTEGRAFTHRQVRGVAYAYAALTSVSVVVAIPVWQWLGLMR